MSMMSIAKHLDVSHNKVAYWMSKHAIQRRSISDAIYQHYYPDGDPFTIKSVKTPADSKLLGMGLGLYWGEGNKANKTSIRLGNTDPALIKMFIAFLVRIFGVQISDMRFGLQIFSDTNPQTALEYWIRELRVEASQFYKVTVTISGSVGTYRKKCTNGVLTVYYNNKRLRDILVSMLPR